MGLHNYLGRLNRIVRDKNKRKNAFKVGKEVISLALSNGEIPIHYASKFLYREESGHYKDYLSTKEEVQVRFSKNLHTIAYHTLLKNKLSSALYFEECGLAVPHMPLYNIDNIFFYQDINFEIKTTQNLFALLKRVFDTEKCDNLFIKELAESGGTGCFLLKKEYLGEQLHSMGHKLLNRSFIYQETIKQHKILSAINTNSLNTLRFETYIDKQEKAHIVSCYIRFGVGTSVVDNAGAGGFFMSINAHTGKLQGKGYQKLKANGGGKTFTHHPNTQHVLEDVQIPFYKEACDLVLKAVKFVPERYVGWDIAIAEDGPVVIEGNAAPHISVGDIAYGGYKKHPLFPEILQEAFKAPIHTDRIMYFKNL